MGGGGGARGGGGNEREREREKERQIESERLSRSLDFRRKCVASGVSSAAPSESPDHITLKLDDCGPQIGEINECWRRQQWFFLNDGYWVLMVIDQE